MDFDFDAVPGPVAGESDWYLSKLCPTVLARRCGFTIPEFQRDWKRKRAAEIIPMPIPKHLKQRLLVRAFENPPFGELTKNSKVATATATAVPSLESEDSGFYDVEESGNLPA